MMRLLILAFAVSALAQPALAREHSRHHARASAHAHNVHVQHGSRHYVRARTARRHRAPVFAYAGERFGAVEDRQLEYRPAPVQGNLFADLNRPVERPFASTFARQPSVQRFEQPSVQRFERGAVAPAREGSHGALDAMISRHAQMNGLPESLVHRVVIRESRYNARAVGRGGAMGLMQIKYSTARAMGYAGSPSGLLDPETNLTYAVRYLAGAYRVAGGNPGGAVSNYARGYYASAKRAGVSPYAGQDEGQAWSGAQAWSDAYASAPVERVSYSRRRAEPLWR